MARTLSARLPIEVQAALPRRDSSETVPRAVDVGLANPGIRFEPYEILFEHFAATCLVLLIGLKNLPHHQPVSENQELVSRLGTVEMGG